MATSNKGSWIEERRDLFIKNIVRDFVRSHRFFCDLEARYKEEGISYKGLDEWIGTETDKGSLWELKDLAHDLWKHVNPRRQPRHFLMDWMLGTIFHEAMKLKENVYMVHRYQPTYRMAQIPSEVEDGEADKCDGFFQDTVNEISKGMKRLRCLFNKANNHLKHIVHEEKDNAILIRYILEEKWHAGDNWSGDTGLGMLLHSTFQGQLDRAYCLAGESYLEGSWYTEARMAFDEALRINPYCMEARSGLRILEKRLKELALMLEREYAVQTSNLCGNRGAMGHHIK